MKKSSMTYLEKLLNAPSPTGYEDGARNIWRAEMKSFADKVYGDTHGNSFAVLNEKGKRKVMLAGHIDEIGFQVQSICDGVIKFQPLGGFDTNIIPGRRVIIHTAKGDVPGVIGKKAIHLMSADERKKTTEFRDMWIDTGIYDEEELKKTVEIGDPITYGYTLEKLAHDVYVGRGVDDRIGAFIIGEVLRNLKGKDLGDLAVYAVATVQEEIGLRGAVTAAGSIKPEFGFAVDVCHCLMPGVGKDVVGDVTMGKGAVVTRGPNINPKLFDLVVKTAGKKKIAFQRDAACRGTGTDANAMQLSSGGVACQLISIPNRYMHTPVELFDMKDVESAIALMTETILAVDKKTSFVI